MQDLRDEFQSYFTRLKDGPRSSRRSRRARQAGWESAWDFAKTAARLAWVEAIRTVYGAALGLLGVSAPERMDRPQEADAGTDQERDDERGERDADDERE